MMKRARTHTHVNTKYQEWGTLVHCWWQCKWYSFVENSKEFPKKLKIEQAQDLATPLLIVYLKKQKQKKTKTGNESSILKNIPKLT